MDFVDLLYFSSLLLFPVIGIIASNYFLVYRYIRVILWLVVIFAIHNTCFLLGYSLKGDNADYMVFAFEYPFTLLILIRIVEIRNNIFTKLLQIGGYMAMIIGILMGGFNLMIIMFPTNMDYISDKQFTFKSNNKTYEVRRYNFSFVTLMNAKYTFDTYRKFDFLPIEKQIDTQVFWDNQIDMDISGDLTFKIIESKGQEELVFSSGGKSFTKILKSLHPKPHRQLIQILHHRIH